MSITPRCGDSGRASLEQGSVKTYLTSVVSQYYAQPNGEFAPGVSGSRIKSGTTTKWNLQPCRPGLDPGPSGLLGGR